MKKCHTEEHIIKAIKKHETGAKVEDNTDNGLRQRLKALATQYPRYGYLMLHCLLRGEG